MAKTGILKNRGKKALKEIISNEKYTKEQKRRARKELRSRS